MEIDLALAIAHHLGVFAVIGIVAAEFVLLRPGLTGDRLVQLSRIDGAYGVAAGVVLVAGIARVVWGANEASYYMGNQVFWAKFGLFVLVGLLSIQPTMSYVRWSRALKTDPAYTPPAAEIATSRRFIHLEVVGLALIPMFAAAMARGYGVT